MELRNFYKFFVGKSTKKLGDLELDGRISDVLGS
jgi:hypothetical protein